MFKKFFNASYLSIEAILRLVYFILGILFIAWISYLFGHIILDGHLRDINNFLVGNDSAFAISLVYWFDKFYPKIPIWYTVQGMGVSLFYSYPIWTTFLIIAIKNISHLTVMEVFRILSFIAFPLTAIGIYLLAWVRLKKQTVGLLAGIFFLLSQASWLFQTLHGIFAQSFSFVFVAPTLLFFDLFLTKVIKKETKSIVARIYLIMAVVFMGVTFLMHFVTGVMLTITLGIWALGWYLLSGTGKINIKFIAASIWNAILPTVAVVSLGYCLGAFWLIPFNSYTNLANVGGFNTRDLPALREESLRIPSILGMNMLGQGNYRYDFFFFAGSVLIFFAVGTILAVVRKEKFIIISAFVSMFFIFLTTVPIYLPWLASIFKFFFTGVYFRGIIPALILLPIVAAWGAWAIPGLIYIPLKKIKSKPVNDIVGVAVSVAAILISFIVVSNFKPSPPPNPDFAKSYKYQFQPYGPSLTDDFNSFLNKPYLSAAVPTISLNRNGLEGKTILNEALSEWFPADATTIFDVSPYAAGGAILQGAGILNNSRFVNLYHYYASLIHGMWGYQAGQFYGTDKLYKAPEPLVDLSDWFGIKYVVLTPGYDPFYKYEAAGWVPEDEFNAYARSVDRNTNKDNWGIEVWKNPNALGLISITNRPVVLSIGDTKHGSYDNVFRSGNLGALYFKDAILVQGSKNIDDYSLSTLKEFGGLILNGYSYKNKGGAWDTIQKYLEVGGKVFVDSGWQYESADWEGQGLPDVFPVTKTSWSSIGTSWDGVQTVVFGTDIAKFDPLTWKGSAWGMAVASRSDLKSGSTPLIWKNDQILMASRNVGKGKIIWSGMNIYSHIALGMNDAEAALLGQITRSLFAVSDSKDFNDYSYARPFPDNALITLNSDSAGPYWVLFREANSPYTHVSLTGAKSNISPEVYKAGPGFDLIRLDKVSAGDKLQIEVSLNLIDGPFAKFLSLISLVFLIAYLFIGDKIVDLLNKFPIDRFGNRLSSSLENTFIKDEEDY